jgi:hypothetical protein
LYIIHDQITIAKYNTKKLHKCDVIKFNDTLEFSSFCTITNDTIPISKNINAEVNINSKICKSLLRAEKYNPVKTNEIIDNIKFIAVNTKKNVSRHDSISFMQYIVIIHE